MPPMLSPTPGFFCPPAPVVDIVMSALRSVVVLVLVIGGKLLFIRQRPPTSRLTGPSCTWPPTPHPSIAMRRRWGKPNPVTRCG